MLRAGGSSPATFPSIDFDLPVAAPQVTPSVAPALSNPLPAPVASATSSTSVSPQGSSPELHKQAYIERAVRQVTQIGAAAGLTHPDTALIPEGVNIETREAYMEFRSSLDGGGVAAVQAAAEWNEVAVDFARQHADQVFDQFRQDYVKSHIMSVLKSGIATGLTLFGRNIENREGFIASRIVGNVQRDVMIQSKRAESDWNKLAAGYAKDAGERLYARLFPIDAEGIDIFASPMAAQQKAAPVMARAQAANPLQAAASDDLFPPIPGFADVGPLEFSSPSQGMTLDFAAVTVGDGSAGGNVLPQDELEVAHASYQAFVAALASMTMASMTESMKKLSDLLLFQVHTDQSLKGHPLNPHRMASAVLLAR